MDLSSLPQVHSRTVLIDLFTVYVILGLVICVLLHLRSEAQKQNGDTGFESAESNSLTFFLLKSSLSAYFAYISFFSVGTSK